MQNNPDSNLNDKHEHIYISKLVESIKDTCRMQHRTDGGQVTYIWQFDCVRHQLNATGIWHVIINSESSITW